MKHFLSLLALTLSVTGIFVSLAREELRCRLGLSPCGAPSPVPTERRVRPTPLEASPTPQVKPIPTVDPAPAPTFTPTLEPEPSLEPLSSPEPTLEDSPAPLPSPEPTESGGNGNG